MFFKGEEEPITSYKDKKGEVPGPARGNATAIVDRYGSYAVLNKHGRVWRKAWTLRSRGERRYGKRLSSTVVPHPCLVTMGSNKQTATNLELKIAGRRASGLSGEVACHTDARRAFARQTTHPPNHREGVS